MANFFHTIYQTLTANPARVFLHWKGMGSEAGISGQELLSQITKARMRLEERGVKTGQAVLIALPMEGSLVSGLLGTMSMGAVPVLPPAKASVKDIWQIIRTCDIKGIMLAQKPRVWVRALAKLLGLKLIDLSKARILEWQFSPNPPVDVPEDQAALISHSSGSTGKPKAIIRSHAVLQAQHLALKEAFPPVAEQRDFPLFPNVLLHNLSLGIVSIVPDGPWTNPVDFSAAAIIRQLQEQQVQSMTGNVFYYTRLLQYLLTQSIQVPGVTAIGIGGSPVPEKLPHQLKKYFPTAEVFIIYGSSEAEPIAIRKVEVAKPPAVLGYVVGKVCPTLQIKIDENGQITLPGGHVQSVGEILVKGAHVALPQKNQWLHTGDFGYLDESKNLILTGRKGNETIVQGVQHYQIEQVLSQIEGIERVAAKAFKDRFEIFVQGRASEENIENALQKTFPTLGKQRLHFKKALPVDNRHHSKILYANLR